MLRKITDLLLLHPSRLSSVAPQTFPNRVPPPSHQLNPQLPPLSKLKFLCINGQLKEAVLEMAIQGLQVKFDGYDLLLTECISQKAITEGRRVHTHMIKTRYLPPVFLNTKLIVLYSKCGDLEDARHVLDGMFERNVVSWTAMISAYAQRGRQSEALDLFVRMLETGIVVSFMTPQILLVYCLF